jgi:translation initiation factor IF-1
MHAARARGPQLIEKTMLRIWLRPGDLLSVEVEIDPAFPENHV